jgi:hypothetical protein
MEIKLKLPESFDDVSMEQYVNLLKLIDKYDLTEPDQVLKYRIEQIHALNPEVSIESLMKLRISQLKEYFQSIEFLDSQPITHNSKVLDIDGVKYEFQDLKLMSLEQWIDSEKYSTSIESAHRLVSIFFIESSKYSESELDKVSEFILKSPVTKYFWVVSNFFFIHEALGLAINLYSNKLTQQQKTIKRTIEKAEKYDKIIKQAQVKLRGFKFWKT